MSVRKPTETSITKQLSNARKKFKTVNPISLEGRNLKKRIKRLENLSKPITTKFTGTGKNIGNKKTKTGQFKEKPKEVKTPFFKLKDDPSKRLRAKRLALEKANREKVRLAKGRKASEKLQDIPPVSKPKKKVSPVDKPAKTYGGKLTTKKKVSPVDKPAKTYGGKLTPKRTDIKTYPIKSETSTDDAKTHMIKLQAQGKDATVIGDERGSTVVVTSGKLSQDQTNRAKAALARRTKKKVPSGDKPGMRIGSQVGKRKSAIKGIADPLAVKDKSMPKKVVKPVSKKVVPSKLAKITPRRKPTPPSVNGSKVKSKSKGVSLYPRPTSTADAKQKATSAKMTGKLAEKHEGDPHLIRKPKAKTPKHEFGDPALGLGPKKPKTKAKTPKKSEEGFLGFKQISGPKDWSGGIREYETPFGNITIDSSQENLTDEQKERKKIGLSYKKGGQIKVPKKKKVGKKKQGYKARKDESIAMRVKKKRTKKQLKASRSDSYGKFGKGKGKGKINRSGAALVASSYD